MFDKHKTSIIILTLGIGVLLVAGVFVYNFLQKGEAPSVQVQTLNNIGEEAEIEGVIVSIDTSQLEVDGDAVVEIETEEYGKIEARIPAREMLCESEINTSVLSNFNTGESVFAKGKITAKNRLTICESPEHTLRSL